MSAESLDDPALESLGSTIPENISSIPDNLSSIADNLSSIPDNISSIPDNISTIPDNLSTISDNLSTIPVNETVLSSSGLDTTDALNRSLISVSSAISDVYSIEREVMADVSDGEEGPLHATEVNADIVELNRLFINEKCAPDILPADSELIENIKAYLENQENVIETLEEEAENFKESKQVKEANLLTAVYQMEVDRIKFVLHGYQRLRLRKICSNITYLLNNQGKGAGDVLSDLEYKFAQDYSKIFLDHLNDSFLKNLPHELSSFNYQTMCNEPNLKGFVFIRILEDLGRVLFADLGQAPPDLRKGEIYVCQYEAVKAFVLEGKIELI